MYLCSYILVSPNGVTGYDWVWLIGALVANLGRQGGSAYRNRQRMGMTKGLNACKEYC